MKAIAGFDAVFAVGSPPKPIANGPSKRAARLTSRQIARGRSAGDGRR
jgi:hypothetical protein